MKLRDIIGGGKRPPPAASKAAMDPVTVSFPPKPDAQPVKGRIKPGNEQSNKPPAQEPTQGTQGQT